jgi:hypothetical protein
MLCCGGLGACSGTFVYNQLDWLIPWYVDDYVDLTREQKKSFKQRLLPLLEWHRGEELDNYVLLLGRLEMELQQPVTAATLSAWSDEIQRAYRRLEERSWPLAFELGEQLSDAQVAEFMAGLYDGQKEMEEEYLTRTDEEVHEDSYENFVENVSDVLGRLQTEQKERLRAASEELQRYDNLWLQRRLWWLQQTEELLRREPGWQQRARDLIASRDELESPEYRSITGHNQEVIYAALADVLNSRTEQQNSRLVSEIDGIRQDLVTLSRQEK